MSLPPSVESPGGYFLSWQPGRGPTLSPNGLAWPLEPKSDIVLQAHMQPSGKPEVVQPKIAFYFTEQVPTNSPFKISLSSINIDIPAEGNGEIQDSYVLPVDVELLAVLPHAHYLGKHLQGFATLPNGEKRTLLNINEWDFNWQSDYRYLEPVRLPKGTRLGMHFTYDNSSANPRNPNRPPVRVSYGVRTVDEMGELLFQVLPNSPAGLRTLEADYGRKLLQDVLAYNTSVLRQNPKDAHAHVQFGKALGVLGRTKEALEHLRFAVEIDPNEEEGHYNLGALLMSTDLVSAEKEFNETLRLNPENVQARNNLGVVLMRFGRLPEAEVQFQAALQLNPEDRIVLDNINLLRKQSGR
jgi:tetratricopeptide (TPR) repeat protein